MAAGSPYSAPGGQRRIPALDGLRGLCAVAVMLYHLTWFVPAMLPGTPGLPHGIWWGCYGVQVFFAISGFVILGTLDRTRDLGTFARGRARRLLPTYWLAMLTTFTVAAVFGPDHLRVGGRDLLANVVPVQSLTRVAMVDGVYWSLNVEIAFYACIAVAWRLGALRRVEIVVLAWLALKWLWWACGWPGSGLGLALVVDHIPYFAIGMLAYRIHAGQRSIAEQAPILACVVATVLVIDPIHAHWLCAGLIAGFVALAKGQLAWLGWWPLAWLGAISYPLYLVHAVIGYTIIAQLERHGMTPLAASGIAVVGVVVLAAALSRLVDGLMAARPHASRPPLAIAQ
ncbi:MAG TPA: acyltransferase [Sphingomonas sp.]|jgi:peptidoglycan/LPS O-acetylase OafA/YrhL|nr:acyltransferase [Sphingomonas sp.]